MNIPHIKLDFGQRNKLLLDNYLQFLKTPSDFDPSRPLAGEGTRNFFDRSMEYFFKNQDTWEDFASSPLDKIWVWSDLHINHKNIIKYAERKFNSVEQMNKRMLDLAIQNVAKDDWLFFGGDIGMGPKDELSDWLKKCPGKKVLMVGNHDRGELSPWLDKGFMAITPVLDMVLKEPLSLNDCSFERLLFTHYPLNNIPNNCLNIHGHIHQKRLAGNFVNICVEHTNMGPEKLSQRLSRWSPQFDKPINLV